MKRRAFFSAYWIICPFISLMFAIGCKHKAKFYEPSYTIDSLPKKTLLFGVPSQAYYELTDSIVGYLNERLHGVQLQTVASSSFNNYNAQLAAGYFDITIANGMTALEAIHNGYSIIGQVVDQTGNSGTIVVNKDSSIKTFLDLKGKTVATPGSPALPGHMLQMLFLAQHGLDVNKDFKFRYFESFESVFLNVYLGRCSAGFSTTTSWNAFIKRRPEIGSRVVQKWQTSAIIGNAVLFRSDMNKSVSEELKNLLLSMHTNTDGERALAKIGFIRFDWADSSSYSQIKDLTQKYKSQIGEPKN